MGAGNSKPSIDPKVTADIEEIFSILQLPNDTDQAVIKAKQLQTTLYQQNAQLLHDRNRCGELESKLKEAMKAYQQFKEGNERLSTTNQECKNTISGLQSDAQRYQQAIQQYKSNDEKQKQTIQNLQSKEQSQQKQIQQLETSDKNQNDVIRKLNTKSQGDDKTVRELKATIETQQQSIHNLQIKEQNQKQIISELSSKEQNLTRTNEELKTTVKQLERDLSEMKSKMESMQRVEKSRSEGKIIDSSTTTSLKVCREKLMKIRDTYCFDFFDELTLDGNEQEIAFCLLVRNVFESGENNLEIKDCFESYISKITPYMKDQSKLEEVRNMFEEYQRIVKDARELNQIVRNMSSPTFHLVWSEFNKQYHDVTNNIKLPAENNQKGIQYYQLSPALTYGSENNISEKATFLELNFQ